MNDVNTYIKPAEEKMEMAVEYLDETLAHIRSGKANPKILDGVKVDYYGSAAPVSNVANISVPDARTIVITPWEKSMFKEIEKAIINSEIGITPENNGEVIRLSIPPLTEERRKALVKQSKGEAEQAKISVRNARRDAIDGLKKAVDEKNIADIDRYNSELEAAWHAASEDMAKAAQQSGPQGPQGPQNPEGPQGPQNPEGPQGPAPDYGNN